MSYAVITGAASGLGRSFAIACAERGHNLLLADMDEHRLAGLADELSVSHGIDTAIVPGDLRNGDTRKRLVSEAEGLDSVDLWINNAGISAKGPAKYMDPERATMVAQLNVTALTNLATCAVPLLLKAESGRMINVSSLGAWYPIPYMAAYAASKAYILHFSMALNKELAGTPVTVSTLCPGGMRTNIMTIRDLDGQGLFGRLTIHSPDKVANLALDLSARGKGIIIPGLWNNFLRSFGSMFPKSFLARNLERRWRRSLTSSGLMNRED